MLPNIDYRELPRALQHMLERGRSTPVRALPRRSFLKLTGTLGLAVGIFPHLAAAQSTDAGEAPTALKPTEQPSAFVQIAPNGEVMVTINRLEFGQGVQTALPMILAEELDADWNLVRSQLGTNDMAYVDPLFGMHLTGVRTPSRTALRSIASWVPASAPCYLRPQRTAGTWMFPRCEPRPVWFWLRMAASSVMEYFPKRPWPCPCLRK